MSKKNRSFFLTAAGASLLAFSALAESAEEAAESVEAAAVKTEAAAGSSSPVLWIVGGVVVALILLAIIVKIVKASQKKKKAAAAVAAYKQELDAKRAQARAMKEAAEEAARTALPEAVKEAAETVETVAETSQEKLDEAMERMAEAAEAIEAEAPAVVAEAVEAAAEPVEEVLVETAHEVIPASIDGRQIYRFFPDVVIDPANYDVSSVQLGQPVSFVTIGKNLFAQSKRKIIGRVTKKSVAEKVAAWQLDKKLMAAVVTDADASDGDLKVTIAFYDDLLKVAEEKGAKMIKLTGTKNEEAQANIVKAKVGCACRAAYDKRENNGKEDRWKVYTEDGYVGVLPEDDYYNDGSMRIVVAEVATSKKDDKASIWVYVI